jgi:hypothetical protein
MCALQTGRAGDANGGYSAVNNRRFHRRLDGRFYTSKAFNARR